MKKGIVILLAVVLVLSSLSFAFAATNAITKSRSLSFSGTTANISASVQEQGSACAITARLYRGSLLIMTWSDSGDDIAAVSGSVSDCTHGQTYTLTVTATVNGVSVPIADISKTCP